MRKSLIVTIAFAILATAALPAFAGWEEAVAAFRNRDFAAAASEFQKLVDQSPEEYRYHYMLGLTFQQQDRKAEALNHLRKAYNLNPNDLGIKLALGKAYTDSRRYQEVTGLFESVDASKLPVEQRPAFYRMRGDAYLKTDNVSAAMKDYKALTQADPKNSDYHYKYGAIALKADQLDTAIRALDQAVRLDAGNMDKTKTYASALIQKGRLPGDKVAKKSNYLKASELASKVVAKDGSFDNLMILLSAQLGAGLYSDAAKTGERAMAKNSKDWIVPFYIGQAYTSDGKFAQAVDPLKKALELADANNQKKVWRQLGFAYEKMKNLEESIAAYQKAGDNAGLNRVRENLETAQYNEQVEAENAQIRAMEEEAKRLEEELKKLEEGGGV